MLMVLGGQALSDGAKRICEAFAGGPHIFNLGHGITPDADPSHVDVLLKAIRG
jgi:uroporphyrinogen decarboxylase